MRTRDAFSRWVAVIVLEASLAELSALAAKKSLEQVIRWGDRVNQELCRWRKLEDRKCWRAWARRIRTVSRARRRA